MDCFDMQCPNCEGGDIEVGIISHSSGRPATRLDPEEPPEIEWKITGSCEGCDLSQADLEDGSFDPSVEEEIIEAINEQAWEYLGDEEQGAADAAADREYEEWKDRQLFGEE